MLFGAQYNARVRVHARRLARVANHQACLKGFLRRARTWGAFSGALRLATTRFANLVQTGMALYLPSTATILYAQDL